MVRDVEERLPHHELLRGQLRHAFPNVLSRMRTQSIHHHRAQP
jgi:hypothetical protein